VALPAEDYNPVSEYNQAPVRLRQTLTASGRYFFTIFGNKQKTKQMPLISSINLASSISGQLNLLILIILTVPSHSSQSVRLDRFE